VRVSQVHDPRAQRWPRPRSRVECSDQQGSGTVWVLTLTALVALVGLVGVGVAGAAAARHRAGSAADLAALAAASAAATQPSPCAAARRAAQLAGAVLVRCSVNAGISAVEVSVAVPLPGGPARARARAGPAEQR